jgi:NAD(P)H-flavin reductase
VAFEDILLKDELDNLSKEDDQFRIYYVLNKPPAQWSSGVGFVTPKMIKVNRSTYFSYNFVVHNYVLRLFLLRSESRK